MSSLPDRNTSFDFCFNLNRRVAKNCYTGDICFKYYFFKSLYSIVIRLEFKLKKIIIGNPDFIVDNIKM